MTGDDAHTPGDITVMLRAAADGDTDARSDLLDALYADLKQCAAGLMQRQPSGHTLQATAVVHEVYMRLFRSSPAGWTDRRHFLLAASRAMRHLLVDHARRRNAAKRDGVPIPLEESTLVTEFESRAIDLEALDVALKKLANEKPEMARAVELRFFADVSQEEVARILDMPHRTFQRRWAMTRAWLFEELR